MKVRITKRHIAHGIRRSGTGCPLALALPRDAVVGWPSITAGGVLHRTADAARAFIGDFDAGRPVSPGWLTVWE